MTDEEIEQAVEQRRLWLLDQVDLAATHLGAQLTGAEVVNTYDMRSAGTVATDSGTEVWLRVVTEDPDYQPACRWDGNVTANAIEGVPKPDVLRWVDWDNRTEYRNGCRMRAEVMTLVPAKAIAQDAVLTTDPGLPETWWSDVRTAIDALAKNPVPPRSEVDTVGFTLRGVEREFGVQLNASLFDMAEWTTAHADLHWSNITGPDLWLLDWESWRRDLLGYDAATLLCNSLLVPHVADRVQAVFADQLDTPTGRLALLAAVVRYLANADEGGIGEALAPSLRKIGDEVLASIRK
ncbi:hypothetical protein [Alloactinosynnema sp. L-07]|uniref:hypothetical protein n=1 Tax=Alloactinosynnema sp. L-07 TaxID=1653480 RepID=UPI00065EF3F6|nr:hypothetical protein [Alloactinosynnema sp. L-07]CRK60509.1 hypothetical protein [Alloactinosynnema sp. L-07]